MKSLFFYVSVVALLLGGCDSSTGSSSTVVATGSTRDVGLFLDAPVVGLEYSSKSHSGFTNSSGYFNYNSGEEVTFKAGKVTLGKIKVTPANSTVTPISIVPNSTIDDTRVVEILRVLQTLDSDNNSANEIVIPAVLKTTTAIDLSENHTKLDDSQLASLIGVNTTALTTETQAKTHFSDSLSNKNQYKTKLESDIGYHANYDSDSDDNDNDSDSNDNENDSDSDNDSSTSGGTTTPVTISPITSTTSGTYTLLAWNDLGMHCFDGSDFSIFSILPPYNNLNAHLITKVGTSNKHVTANVTLTYESLTYNGHINTKSSTKTNFWSYLTSLFPGASSVSDIGLTGNATPSTVPHAMVYSASSGKWEADGIPIVNRDDNNAINYYPMVRVVAKNTAGTTLATADVVLPVSDEMDCKKCHASTVSSSAARPIAGWENSADALKDYKLNILKLHDEKHPINAADLSSVKAKGYTNYQTSLYDTAKAGTPILCASCHSSNALGTTNIGNAKPLTTSLHAKHASVIDPSNNLRLNDSTNRNACYSCHPGAATECLRGAMGSAKNADGTQMMQCQSCHGTMNDVGNANRKGWMDEPNCQVCHQNGQRYSNAIVGGSMRSALDTRFATNPNTPSAGVSLYKLSTGHGDLQCSSCHGSTHAIFPSSHAEDNVLSTQVQGHSGTIAECTACHTTMPNTTTGGPHGMHSVGQGWVNSHEDVAERNSAQCTSCHGSDYRGSDLSKTFSARTLSAEHKTKTYAKGAKVGCYDCHGKEW
ncbi:MAG: multiheme c-type cytochrome [Sulfurimonas sp.]|nr:multiheme c-type cytochrome [Sulfurimonas sp.]